MDKNLVWVDLEFTGLNPDTDVIIEMASIITDSELKIIAEGPNLAIFHPQEVLDTMDEWNRTHHGESGLIERVKKSTESHESAQEKTLEFIKKYCNPNTAPLCGNSIHQDRRYIAKYMPKLNEYLHYRIIDVSTIKELARRWVPELPSYPKKETHLALADIKESIGELLYYKKNMFYLDV